MAGLPPARKRFLIIGALEYIGSDIAFASIGLGHPTSVLIPRKYLPGFDYGGQADEEAEGEADDGAEITDYIAQLIIGMRDVGITIVPGSIHSVPMLRRAIRQADVVISAVNFSKIGAQANILKAIKQTGYNIWRFVPSEFGLLLQDGDLDMEEYHTMRNMIERSGVPYTYMVSNIFTQAFLRSVILKKSPNGNQLALSFFEDQDNVRAIFAVEQDIGTYTVLAADDMRTLNQTVYIRPPANIMTRDQVVSLWENKLEAASNGSNVTKQKALDDFEEAQTDWSHVEPLVVDSFLSGELCDYDDQPQPTTGMVTGELYPQVNYTTVSHIWTGSFHSNCREMRIVALL